MKTLTEAVFVLGGILVLAAVMANRPPGPHHKFRVDDPEPPPAVPEPKAKATLTFFTAKWCGPCQRMHQVLKDPKVQEELKRFTVREVDVDLPENADEVKLLEVTSIPCFTVTGPKAQWLSGYRSANDFVKWLKSLS